MYRFSLSTHLQKDSLSLTVDNVWVIKVTFTSEEALGSRRQNIARWTISCYQREAISSHDLELRREGMRFQHLQYVQ